MLLTLRKPPASRPTSYPPVSSARTKRCLAVSTRRASAVFASSRRARQFPLLVSDERAKGLFCISVDIVVGPWKISKQTPQSTDPRSIFPAGLLTVCLPASRMTASSTRVVRVCGPSGPPGHRPLRDFIPSPHLRGALMQTLTRLELFGRFPPERIIPSLLLLLF